jgi:hypothetical protein
MKILDALQTLSTRAQKWFSAHDKFASGITGH